MAAPDNPTLDERLAVIRRVARRELKQVHAARRLGLSVRQIRRLVARYKQVGPDGLVHGLRGRPANNRASGHLVRQAMVLLATRYPDLGPSAAADHLSEQYDINLSRETLRRSMIEAGLWEPGRGRTSQPVPKVLDKEPEEPQFSVWLSP